MNWAEFSAQYLNETKIALVKGGPKLGYPLISLRAKLRSAE